MGTAALGLPYGIAERGRGAPALPTKAEVVSLLRAAENSGISTFDTAPAYGDAETYLGEVLGPACRIWTKFGHRVALDSSITSMALSSVERSLSRFHRSRLEVLAWHNWTVQVGKSHHFRECWRRLREDPRIASLGASTYGPDDAEVAMESGWFDVLQVEWNLLNQGVLRRLARVGQDGPLLALRSVFLQGVLTDRWKRLPDHLAGLAEAVAQISKEAAEWGWSVATLALRAALDQAGTSRVVIGLQNENELRQALSVAAMSPLSAEQLSRLESFDRAGDPVTDPRTWPNQ
jgi:aryl-alcohol dehydrogenase-like predicted oxidoreductase